MLKLVSTKSGKHQSPADLTARPKVAKAKYYCCISRRVSCPEDSEPDLRSQSRFQNLFNVRLLILCWMPPAHL